MPETFTIESISFKMKTQAMLNFAPMIFQIRQPRRRDTQLSECHFWDEAVHKMFGNHVITTVDQHGALHEIKINQFIKEYPKLLQTLESNPGLIHDNFNILQEGLIKVPFDNIMKLAYDKYAMQQKMRSRSSL